MPIRNWAHARQVLTYLKEQELKMMGLDNWIQGSGQFDTEQDQEREDTECQQLHVEYSLTYDRYFIVDKHRFDVGSSDGYASYLEAEAEMHFLQSS